jgi:hypothetical protein
MASREADMRRQARPLCALSGIGAIWRRLACAGALITAASLACACGGPGSGSPSAAAVTWVVRPAPGVLNDAISTDDTIVAVGSTWSSGTTPTASAAAWRSTDGVTWTPAPLEGSAEAVRAVAGGTGGYVAVGSAVSGDTTRPAVWTSADGRSWRAVATADAFAPLAGCDSTSLDDVAAGRGGFVAVGVEWGPCGQRGAAWSSPDGRTWTRAPSATGGNGTRVVIATDIGYVAAGAADAAAGEGMRAAFWWSADGRSWTMAADQADFHGAEPAALLATASGVLAVGSAIRVVDMVPVAWRSADGRAWVRLPAAGLTPAPPSNPSPAPGETSGALTLAGRLLAVDGGLVATGATMASRGASGSAARTPWRLVIWTSTTGDAWARVPDDPALELGPSDAFSQGPTAVVAHSGHLVLSAWLPGGGGGTARTLSADLQALVPNP